MLSHRYLEENGSAAMLAAKRSAGITPEVNLKECVTHMPLSRVNKKGCTLSLKPKGNITRSPKQVYQWTYTLF